MVGQSGLLTSAVVRRDEGARWGQKSLPAPGAGEALVRVLLAGICRTDLHAADGTLRAPALLTLGHEFAGEVEAAAPGCPLPVGARVTADPLLACGGCVPCVEGAGPCGEPVVLGVDRDGVFAERALLPWSSLHRVPDTLPLARAAYAEPVAAALAVLKAPIEPGQRGLLLGHNRIAALTHRILVARGFSVTLAREGDALPACSFDFAIETLATAATMQALLRALRPGGCLVLKSRPAAPVPLDVALAVRKDLRLHAVNYGSFAQAIELLATLPVDDLLGPTFALRDFEAAFAEARRSEDKKIFLRP